MSSCWTNVIALNPVFWPQKSRKLLIWHEFIVWLKKNGHNSLNIGRRAPKVTFLERALNFTLESTIFARLQLFGNIGLNENANAFSLNLGEKVLTQHF